MKVKSPILEALDEESYDWLELNALPLLAAIEHEVVGGMNPDAVRRMVAEHVGADRMALAVRAYHAARHVTRTQRG